MTRDPDDPHITEEQGRILIEMYQENEERQAQIRVAGTLGVGLPAQEMRHHIDGFAVNRGKLVADGWCEAGLPAVIYRGRPVLSQAHPANRSDLPAHYGPGSERWGFNLRAILGEDYAEHDEIVLLFPNGARVERAGARCAPPNTKLDGMIARFRAVSESGGRALEIGSRARSGNSYRTHVAPSVQYTGLDVTAGPNVDVVGDAHHLSRHVEGPFDFVFSISVFEHLLMPWKVALEMNKVMRPGGLAYIQSHPAWPLHEEPWDFWRFSENAWDGLFNAHTGFKVLDKGCDLRARSVADFATGGHMQAHEHSRTFMLSACLVEKVAEPLVSWEAEAGDLYNLSYDHA